MNTIAWGDNTHRVKNRRSRTSEVITKLNKRMKIPKDAYNVVGGTRPCWSFQNNGLTNEELNETENEQLKEIRQLKRELVIEKEKSLMVSVNFLFYFILFYKSKESYNTFTMFCLSYLE